MDRTKQRALVQGLIPGRHALVYGAVLLALGLLALILHTNLLTTLLALFGFLAYVVLYGYYKRRSPLGTVVGSISGAIPPVVGYCAVTGRFDLGAAILFLILVFWQMPHFYAIAMYRLQDYRAAGIPVLPIKKGYRETKVQILIYILAFIPVTLALTAFGYTGYTYLAVATLLGTGWLALGLTGLHTAHDQANQIWARKMFFFSLIVITVLSIMMSIDVTLP
jgi:heme o synthase